MNNITATIGIEQIKHIGRILEACRRNGTFYIEQLDGISKLEHVRRLPEARSAFWVFTMLVDDRAALVKRLAERGVASSIVHTRNDWYRAFSAFHTHLPGVDAFTARYLSIPCGWWVSPEDAASIVEVIREGW